MAIRFKKDLDTEQQYEKWNNHQSTGTISADSQGLLSPASTQTTVTRRNQLPRLLTKFHLNSSPLWQRWCERWENFNFRTKLTIVLVGTTAISSTIVSQGVVKIASDRLSEQIQTSLQSDINLLTNELESQLRINQDIAVGLAETSEATGLDLTKKSDIEFSRLLLKDEAHNKPEQSFRVIVDAHGRTVAHSVQILQSDFSDDPPLPSGKQSSPKYRPVSLRYGIKLGDIPIIKDAMRTGRHLSGTEMLGAESIEKLGLEKQANIGEHFQESQSLSTEKKPYPETKYNSSGGLVLMAVQPIKDQGKILGAVVVGTLLNRNYQIVDELSQKGSMSLV